MPVLTQKDKRPARPAPLRGGTCAPLTWAKTARGAAPERGAVRVARDGEVSVIAMYEIKGVNATPGGRRTVRFHDHGYAVTPERRAGAVADTFLGEGAGCVTALVLLALIGLYSVLKKTGAPEAALTACIVLFLAALCYGALIALVQWASGVVVDVLIVLLAVLTLPGLLFPGYRRALRRRMGGGGPETERGWVPATALAGVWYQPDPRGGDVVTVRLADGSVTAFVPAPERARDLYDRFDALLRSTRPAPWPPQQHQPWQGHQPHQPYPYPGHPRS
ncbi:hypothetical protein [Streptomyces sp. NPDC096033]|uniref:hypothetical protein n=1 Tax=Streptomyces sp. NPDC096033 TaxID=3366071 RepID=UPI0037F5FE79